MGYGVFQYISCGFFYILQCKYKNRHLKHQSLMLESTNLSSSTFRGNKQTNNPQTNKEAKKPDKNKQTNTTPTTKKTQTKIHVFVNSLT